MQSFHNNAAIKHKYLARVIAHQKADNLIRGIGWKNGKGCAVGCTLESYDHKSYETELGIPEWLARLEDGFFERMSLDKSKTWPEKFLEAIPIGVDLDKIIAPFLIMVLKSTLDTFDHQRFPDVKKYIDQVISLLESGEFNLKPSPEQARAATEAAALAAAWAAALAAAWAAAEAAAWAATEAAALAAAWAAAKAAAWAAAEAAADAATRAAADAAARAKQYDYFADELITLLEKAK